MKASRSHSPETLLFHMHLSPQALCRSCLRTYAWFPMVMLLGAVVAPFKALRAERISDLQHYHLHHEPICDRLRVGNEYAMALAHDFRRPEYTDVRDALNSTPRNAEAAATRVAGESTLRISGTGRDASSCCDRHEEDGRCFGDWLWRRASRMGNGIFEPFLDRL